MTEQEWLTSNNGTKMLRLVIQLKENQWKVANPPYVMSDRQTDLSACACCRASHYMVGEILDYKKVLDEYASAHEDSVDGLITTDALKYAQLKHSRLAVWSVLDDPASWIERELGWTGVSSTEIANILREIVGNPWRSLMSPEYPEIVRLLAQSIYDQRAFNLMSILADALEESGCQDVDMLSHCRCDQRIASHTRGCWVLDRILRKE